MEEYISRKDAVRAVEMQCVDGKMFGADESDMTLVDADDVAQAISEIPAADVDPVRHGQWIECAERSPFGRKRIECSECKSMNGTNIKLNYCPRCDAKMDYGVRKTNGCEERKGE